MMTLLRLSLLSVLAFAAGCGAEDSASDEASAGPDESEAGRPPLSEGPSDGGANGEASAPPPDTGDGGDGGADASLPTGTPATVFTYNMCGADPKCKVADPTASVLVNVDKYRPAAFMLNEVCTGQADRISAGLRAKNLPYVQRFQNAASHAINIGCGGPEGWGNAVFHVGTKLGEVQEKAYATQGNYFTRPQTRAYVCVHVPSPNFWACSTHIDVEVEQQKGQIDELRTVVSNLTNRGGTQVPVIVGGDFNATPDSDRIDSMFAATYARGKGVMLEKDVALNRTITASAATFGTRKIDYLFRTANVKATGGAVINATSDHRLLMNTILLPR